MLAFMVAQIVLGIIFLAHVAACLYGLLGQVCPEAECWTMANDNHSREPESLYLIAISWAVGIILGTQSRCALARERM